MVTTRWAGSVGDRPSVEWMEDLRARGRGLLEQATDPYAIGRFLAADAFFPFWIQQLHEVSEEELALAEQSANRALEIAAEVGDAELHSMTLDAIGGFSTAVNDWTRARDTARERITFEDKLDLYERLDAHSMVAWMSYLMGDLETAERDSAQMVARLMPGQAPYPALHLFAWRAVVLNALGRWDEAVTMFWRAFEAWHDAGSHAAGYALRGFLVGFDIGSARGDMRLTGAATETMESIVTRFPPGWSFHVILSYIQGDPALTEGDLFLSAGYPGEMAERRFNLAADRRLEVPRSLLDAGLEKAQRIKLPLLEAQIRRVRGLASHDASEFDAAIAIWEPRGVVPSLGRAHAERGLITGDQAETDAGLAILKKLGDHNYLDRFASIA
jgi:hypothetical protein